MRLLPADVAAGYRLPRCLCSPSSAGGNGKDVYASMWHAFCDLLESRILTFLVPRVGGTRCASLRPTSFMRLITEHLQAGRSRSDQSARHLYVKTREIYGGHGCNSWLGRPSGPFMLLACCRHRLGTHASAARRQSCVRFSTTC